MKRRWLLTRDDLRARAALLEDGDLAECYEEPLGSLIRCGSIYAGIVRDVVPAIAAAFVEVGPGEKVFLQLTQSDVLLHAGQRVLVQITQSGRVGKAPQASLELKMAGRYVILATGSDHVGVSKRITDVARRDILRGEIQAQLEQLRSERTDTPEFGAIIRSFAACVDAGVTGSELSTLMRSWDLIQERFAHEQQARGASSSLLHEELVLPLRLLRDRVAPGDEVVIEEKNLFDEATSLLASLPVGLNVPDLSQIPQLELFTEYDAPLFEHEGVEEQLLASRTRSHQLPSGGSVVIDVGEALSAIDVNSGSSTDAATLEETAFRTNSEAAVMVARLLRLRNSAGIIIVDFIEMHDRSNREKLMQLFADELAHDHARIRLLPLDELGLAKLTRKKQ